LAQVSEEATKANRPVLMNVEAKRRLGGNNETKILRCRGSAPPRREADYFFTSMALFGHSSAQVPQSVQVLASMTAMSSTLIDPLGHASSQIPQPTQSSAFTLATIK
jgi:hypothetical protein